MVRTCQSPEIVDSTHPRAWSCSRTVSHSRALPYPRYSYRAVLCHPVDKGTLQDPVTLHTQNNPGPELSVFIYRHFPGCCHSPCLALSCDSICDVTAELWHIEYMTKHWNVPGFEWWRGPGLWLYSESAITGLKTCTCESGRHQQEFMIGIYNDHGDKCWGGYSV